MSVVHKDNDIITMGFESSYTQTGNEITILVNESYRDIAYPLSQFEEFKNVINASADFNKIVFIRLQYKFYRSLVIKKIRIVKPVAAQ